MSRVEGIELRDFRNLERASASLGTGLTVVSGPNGAGKTNLLEGVYFGLTARSCRTSNDREMVRRGSGPARVVVRTAAEDGPHVLEVALEAGGGKRARVDGTVVEGPLDTPARPPVAVFVPERLELVKGAPSHRRAHLDALVAAAWPARAETRRSYSRALGQRNALLGRIRAQQAGAGQLDAWDAQLAKAGVALMADRSEAIERLAAPFTAWANRLGLFAAEVRYRPRSEAADLEGLERELGERRAQDLERGFTTHGPHRDDLALAHEQGALRAFGSQGQQRVAVLALLLAERDLLAERGRPPLMLLDDVSSELDAERRSRLVRAITTGGQAVVTTTDPGHLPGADEAGAATLVVGEGQVRSPPHAVAA